MVTDAERAQHEAAQRGLLYLACPDAPAYAITETAAAIGQRSEETPQEPVPEAARLTPRPRPRRAADDPLYLVGADLSGADLSSLFGVDLTGANLTGAILLAVWGMYRAPSGATWNRDTRWPVHLASVVAEQSDEVSPGAFQVRDGPAPERSDTVRA
ncbi:pentapeptide repeat-containing protein [Streptomyces mirabilis]|uniref:pentapeptide repeat-containing protein n=1 Tax=Streptomyces mirabilis TaxID=68239 RepID=UPI0033A1DB56